MNIYRWSLYIPKLSTVDYIRLFSMIQFHVFFTKPWSISFLLSFLPSFLPSFVTFRSLYFLILHPSIHQSIHPSINPSILSFILSFVHPSSYFQILSYIMAPFLLQWSVTNRWSLPTRLRGESQRKRRWSTPISTHMFQSSPLTCLFDYWHHEIQTTLCDDTEWRVWTSINSVEIVASSFHLFYRILQHYQSFDYT